MQISNILYKILIAIFLAAPAINSYANVQPLKRETRAVWLTTLSGLDWPRTAAVDASSRERQKKELTAILDKYQELKINTVLLQTRVRGTLIYPSKIEGWDPCLAGAPGRDPGYDPLKFAIEECHKRGMELHCWMVVFPSGNQKTHAKLGEKSVTRTHPGLCKRIRDYWYLDPGNPATRDYLASICEEVTRNYDIDGIHFDFIRYPEKSADAIDRDSYRRFGKGQDKASWRRENVTEAVKSMFKAVKAIKPWVKISCAPIGKYRDTSRFSAGGWNGYNRVYQDAQKWVKEGYMDILFPMLYFRGNNFYPFVLDWTENCNGRPVVPGLGIYFLHPSEGNWVLSDVKREMSYSRSLGLGVAHYRSKFLTDNVQGLYKWCKDEFYLTEALTPAMTWLDDKAPDAPSALKAEKAGNDGIHLSWTEVKDNDYPTYVTYNIYRSKSLPVDVSRPENLVMARLMENSADIKGADATDYHYAVTSADRFSNESMAVQDTPVQAVAESGSPSSTAKPARPDNLETLACRNGTLFCPSDIAGSYESFEVRAMDGRAVMYLDNADGADLKDLKRGNYQLFGIRKDGRKAPLGFFLR